MAQLLRTTGWCEYGRNPRHHPWDDPNRSALFTMRCTFGTCISRRPTTHRASVLYQFSVPPVRNRQWLAHKHVRHWYTLSLSSNPEVDRDHRPSHSSQTSSSWLESSDLSRVCNSGSDCAGNGGKKWPSHHRGCDLWCVSVSFAGHQWDVPHAVLASIHTSEVPAD